jgi:uncharacterized protein
MLGSLARKLRIFGFDAVYFRDGPDAELELMAEKDRRVILTSDRRLATDAQSKGLDVLHIQGSNDLARLRSLVQQASIASIELEPGGSRCAACNGELRAAKRTEMTHRLPEAVARRHRLYYLCLDCDKAYWKGGHWPRLRRLASSMG